MLFSPENRTFCYRYQGFSFCPGADSRVLTGFRHSGHSVSVIVSFSWFRLYTTRAAETFAAGEAIIARGCAMYESASSRW
jgi:hypothetical protein